MYGNKVTNVYCKKERDRQAHRQTEERQADRLLGKNVTKKSFNKKF